MLVAYELRISDHQQSVVPAPSRGHPHTPSWWSLISDTNVQAVTQTKAERCTICAESPTGKSLTADMIISIQIHKYIGDRWITGFNLLTEKEASHVRRENRSGNLTS
jgi:hypothetical protein